jgi:hypothetical protein
MDEPKWVAVRHVVVEESNGSDHERYFEERITVWSATDIETGIALAAAEVAEYCRVLDLQDTGLYQGFLIADDVGELISGAELFSLIRGSDLEPDEYLDRFFDTGDEIQGTIPSSPPASS